MATLTLSEKRSHLSVMDNITPSKSSLSTNSGLFRSEYLFVVLRFTVSMTDPQQRR